MNMLILYSYKGAKSALSAIELLKMIKGNVGSAR